MNRENASPTMSLSMKDSIGFQLLTIVFSMYFIVTLTVTISHMVIEYWAAKAEVVENLEDLGQVFSPGLSVALWNEDDEQTASLMDGMLEIPIIIGLKTLRDGELVYQIGNLPIEPQDSVQPSNELSEFIAYEFTVFYNDSGEKHEAGKMVLYSNNDVVFEKVQYGFLFIIVNSIIKTLALWWIFLWVSRRILSRPLFELTHSIAKIDLNHLDTQPESLKIRKQNELKILENAFHAMLQKLRLTKQRLDVHLETLQTMTQDLKQAKQRLEVLLQATKEMAGCYDKFNLILNVANTILQETSSTRTAEVHFAFKEYTSEGQSSYSQFHLQMKSQSNHMQLIHSKEFTNLDHMISNILPPSIQEKTTSPTGCFLSDDSLYVPLWQDDQLQGFLMFKENVPYLLNQDNQEFIDTLAQSLAISLKIITYNFELIRARENLEKINADLELKAQEKADIAKVFEKFVPRQFLNRIATEGVEKIQLGQAETDIITILFSDIRSFTSLSENMSPQEILDFLNNYLRFMNAPIHANNGFIDKFIGDAIMALFDSPDSTDNLEAQSAVQAAIGMQEALQRYNQSPQRAGYPEIATGIGIHSGRVIIGTVGSESRMESTVLGDVVNVASRLEGLTKYYNAHIITSLDTYQLLEDVSFLLWRELDIVSVKGRDQPVKIFEVYNSDAEEIRERKQQILQPFGEGLQQYRSRSWKDALELFQECLTIYPDDTVSQMYVERCRKCQETPPGNDWDGVLHFDVK